MNTPLTCGEVEDRVPELALGFLAGQDRAAIVAHLEGCPTCRALSDDLIEVVDELILLTPPAEPPAGFEGRALAAMTATPLRPSRRVPRVRWLAAAALVAVFAAGTLLGTTIERRPRPPVAAAQVAAPLREASLVGHNGASWGEVYVEAGAQPWVFVTMRWDLPDSHLTVVLTGAGIPSVQLSGLDLVNGQGAIGRNVDGDLRNVRTVRVVDHLGRELCQANLS